MNALFDNIEAQVRRVFDQAKGILADPVGQDHIGPRMDSGYFSTEEALYGYKNNIAGYRANKFRANVDYGTGFGKNFEGAHGGAADMAGHMGKSIGRGALVGGSVLAAGSAFYLNQFLGFSPLLTAGIITAPLTIGGFGVLAGPSLAKLGIKSAGFMGKHLARTAISGSAGITNGVIQTTLNAERVFRAVTTGSPINMFTGRGQMGRTGVEEAIDAYLPNFRNMKSNDIRRFAPNTSIVKRLVAGRAVGAVFAGLSELIHPAAPNPTIFYDGVNIRRKNDMGVHAGYGQQLMGASTGMDNAALLRAAAHML